MEKIKGRVFVSCLITFLIVFVFMITQTTKSESHDLYQYELMKNGVEIDSQRKSVSQLNIDYASIEVELENLKKKVSLIEEVFHNTKTFEITAYTAGYESTGKTSSHPEYGITASGQMVEEGRTIACPKDMEFGTKVYIPYFDNTFTCEDRGSAITSGKIDVYMSELSDALNFGRQELDVVVMPNKI